MGKEKNKKCNCEKKEKKKPKPPKPPCPPEYKCKCFPKPFCDIEIVCTKTCGNIHLNHDVRDLNIWKKGLDEKTIVTASFFNSSSSSVSLRVVVIRMGKIPVVLNIPKGNSLSATVEDVVSIIVSHEGEGTVDGTYCLEICFPFRDKKFFFN
ncbi:S-Ena type endospore appendage [Peribacillus butanolivorans]|uniref:S-Ena type endospore appendage n=1 Tax=Peribacillus butanolivorans TaxID=421767 RepID=UPI003D2AA125